MTYIAFDDDIGGEARLLRYDAGNTMTLGYQGISSLAEVSIAAPLETVPLLDGDTNPAAIARMFLGAGGSALLGGDFAVQGTNGEEAVSWLSGELVFDGSFNRGGDRLIVDTGAQNLRAYVENSSVVLVWGDDSASIPFGPTGMDLQLADADTRSIHYDLGSKTLLIGDQTIAATNEASAVQLSALASSMTEFA